MSIETRHRETLHQGSPPARAPRPTGPAVSVTALPRLFLALLTSLGAPAGGRPPLFRMATASMVAMVAVLTLLTGGTTAAYATGGNVCPGGAQSGTSSDPSCSNVHNDDLLPQPEMPATVYRGDDRSTDDIFRNGFTARGTNYDLQHHVHGGNSARDTGFVSTSGHLNIAEEFAEGQGQQALMGIAIRQDCQSNYYRTWIWVPLVGRLLQNACQQGSVSTLTYVYEIDTSMARSAQHVPSQLAGDPSIGPFLRQDEWAYDHWIPAYAIRGARVYTVTAHQTRGFIDSRAALHFDRYIPNPNHRRPFRLYDPAQDPNAHFNFQTNLNVPAQQANQYNRGCSTINRCRGGNG